MEPSALGYLYMPLSDAGEQAVSQMGPIWEQCQQEEKAEENLCLITVTKDVVPTGLVKDGWHYRRELLTEGEISALSGFQQQQKNAISLCSSLCLNKTEHSADISAFPCIPHEHLAISFLLLT